MTTIDSKIPINITQLKSDQSKRLASNCKRTMFLNRLSDMDNFFSSPEWEKSHNDPHSHDLAFFEIKKVFGDRSIIFDCDNATHGKSEYNKLNEGQKSFIKNIDSKKTPGIFRRGNMYVRYIGSTAVGFDSGSGKWKNEIEQFYENLITMNDNLIKYYQIAYNSDNPDLVNQFTATAQKGLDDFNKSINSYVYTLQESAKENGHNATGKYWNNLLNKFITNYTKYLEDLIAGDTEDAEGIINAANFNANSIYYSLGYSSG